MGNALALLCVICVVGLVWQDAMRSREAATAACRRACRSHDAQFLDDTVSLAHLSLTRSADRGIRIRRVYQFEVTYDGAARRLGSVTLDGRDVLSIFVPGSPGSLEG